MENLRPSPELIVSREVRNRWDWYRVIPRQRMLDPSYIRLNAECTGVLERMTWVSWEIGWTPRDATDLAFLTRLSVDEVERALPVLLRAGLVAETEDGRGYWLPRSEQHLQELLAEARVRSERGRKAALARQGGVGAATAKDNVDF